MFSHVPVNIPETKRKKSKIFKVFVVFYTPAMLAKQALTAFKLQTSGGQTCHL